MIIIKQNEESYKEKMKKWLMEKCLLLSTENNIKYMDLFKELHKILHG